MGVRPFRYRSQVGAIVDLWMSLAEAALQQSPPGAWVLLTDDSARPNAAFVAAVTSWIARTGPAMGVVPMRKADGSRHPFDWYQAPEGGLPHRPLTYEEDSPASYPNFSNVLLPLAGLPAVLRLIAPQNRSIGGGANIALARAARSSGLPVALIPTAILDVTD